MTMKTVVRVAVGSKNPAKIKATRNILSKIYVKIPLKIYSVKVDSRVSSQPMGNKTIRGAVNRAKEAILTGKADLGIGIEAGLFKFPYTLTGYVDIQWCAITDLQGRVTVGCNAGFEYPKSIIDRVLNEEKEIGEVMDEATGIKNLGEKFGAIGILSKRHLSRVQLTEQAILMAMIPRLNEKKYF